MRNIVAFAAVAALAACAEPAPEPVAEETTAAQPMAEAGATPGVYDAFDKDGPVGTTTINADGTYLDVDVDGTERRGTYVRRNGQDCFDPDGDETEVCWTASTPAGDGSFTAKSPEGTELTVRPRAADAVPAAEPEAKAPATPMPAAN